MSGTRRRTSPLRAALLPLGLLVLAGCGDPSGPELIEGRVLFEVLDRIQQVGDGEDEVLPLFMVTVRGVVPRDVVDGIDGMTVRWPDGETTVVVDPNLVRGAEGYTARIIEELRPGPPPGGSYELVILFGNGESRTVTYEYAPTPLGRVSFEEIELVEDAESGLISARLTWMSPPHTHRWEGYIVTYPLETASVVADGVRGSTGGGGRHMAGLGFDAQPGGRYAFRIVLMNRGNVRIADFPFTVPAETAAR